MAAKLDEIRLLKEADIKPKERWIYSADANDPGLERMAEEIDDIKQISESGGIVLILAHQGRFPKAKALDNVSTFLSDRLGRQVTYFPQNDTVEAANYSLGLTPGQIAVMGNTRMHELEEKNDIALAGRFSKLGDKVACGGFGKSHRKNSSNVGILEYLPGYLTKSQISAMEELNPWAGNSQNLSIAILGGIKGEKIKDGLAGFLETYDYIIPGGIVLNTILKSKGYDVGDSITQDKGKDFTEEVRSIIKGREDKLLLPDGVAVARREKEQFVNERLIPSDQGVPSGYMIVDFDITDTTRRILCECLEIGGRMVMAGTPGIYTAGFRRATDPILHFMNKNSNNAIVLGGDTAEEIGKFGLSYGGHRSSGGGSALHYLAHGDLPLLKALRKNASNFK